MTKLDAKYESAHIHEGRRGSWIQTFTGLAAYPMDLRPEEIDIRDIAHALSMQCRYGGHSKFFYSTAEHCVILSHAVPQEFAFEALMHDCAEAYLVDVPRPVKQFLPGYKEAEKAAELVIAQRFGLSYPWPGIVMEYDTRILNDEREQVMNTPPMEWAPCGDPLGIRVVGWSPWLAEKMFLARFAEMSA